MASCLSGRYLPPYCRSEAFGGFLYGEFRIKRESGMAQIRTYLESKPVLIWTSEQTPGNPFVMR